MTLTCAITGANGFVGKSLAQNFHKRGWRVASLIRHPTNAPANTEARRFALGELVSPDLLANVDVLVHAAYDTSLVSWADIGRVNVVGSEYLFDAALRAGVKQQILISSMAAFEGCRSLYGLAKLANEEAIRIRGGICIRPGTIYGRDNGGITGKIIAAAQKLPLLPMIGSGNYPLYTCHIDDLCELLAIIIQNGAKEPVITAANPEPITLRQLAESARPDKPPAVIPVPWPLVAAGLKCLETIGLRPAFRSDSVASLVHPNPKPDFEASQQYPVKFRPFSESELD